jgi:hypothetical protein
MSGGGGGTTTVQKADPWSGVQPYLKQLYGGASNAFNQTPQYYPGSTVAQPGQYTKDTLGQMTDIGNNGTSASRLYNDVGSQVAQGQDQTSQDLRNAAMGNTQAGGTLNSIANGNDWGQQVLAMLAGGGGMSGSAFQNMINGTNPEAQAATNTLYGNTQQDQTYGNAMSGNDTTSRVLGNAATGNDATSQYLKSVLSGQYLNGNPYLSQMVGNINKDTTRDFNNSILPGIASQLSAAGRYGSGAGNQAISDAGINLADRLAGNATNIYGQNYATERANQGAAAGQLGDYTTGAAGNLGQYLMGAASGRSNNVNNAIQSLAGQRLAGAQGLESQQAQASQARTGNALNASNALNSNMTSNLSALSGRTLQGGQMLQQAYQNNLTNLGLRQGVSDYFDNLDQQNLSDQVNRWNFNQAQPWQQLNNYNSILNGAMSLNGGTSQQSGSTGRSLLGGAASGALLGGSLAGPLGMAGGTAAGLGAGLGALLGVF